jgi:hypothetical protein
MVVMINCPRCGRQGILTWRRRRGRGYVRIIVEHKSNGKRNVCCFGKNKPEYDKFYNMLVEDRGYAL